MSGADKNFRLGDQMSRFDDQRLKFTTDAGDSFARENPEYKAAQHSGTDFGDWYEGPGGESATKIGLAAIAAAGPGAALLGGESAAAGGTGEGGISGVGSDDGTLTQLATNADPSPILDSLNNYVGDLPLADDAGEYNWLDGSDNTANSKVEGGTNKGSSGLNPQQLSSLAKMMPQYPSPKYAPVTGAPAQKAINLATPRFAAPSLAATPATFAQLLRG